MRICSTTVRSANLKKVFEVRTDDNNNPTAMTVVIAHQGGLEYGTDYEQGTSFTEEGATYYTAKLLGDPIALTSEVISKIGFYTQEGSQRWVSRGRETFLRVDPSGVRILEKIIRNCTRIRRAATDLRG